MNMQPNDYVIAKMKDSKPFLAQVTEVDVGEGSMKAIPDTLRYREERTIDRHKRDILVRLGKDPKPGTVYGVDVANVYRKSFVHEAWGPVHFFVKPDKSKIKILRTSLDVTAKRLDKLDLLSYMGLFQTEIRAKKGKYAGMYKHHQDNKSLLWYCLDMSDSLEDMNYVMYHEFGHVLRFNGLTRVKPRARWQRLFQQSIAPVVVTKKQLELLKGHMLDAMETSSEGSLSSIIKDFTGDDDDLIAQVRAFTRWMKQVHHVSAQDLGVLWSAGDKDTIQSIWPGSSIDTSKLKPVMTDYACKSVEELFAESFAYYAWGKKIPQHIEKLLEKSLTIIKDNVPS
jgi:hypothetical protein